MNETFFDAYLREGETPIICYRSGLTVYEEAISNGVFYPLGWNGAGFTLNVLEDYPSYFKKEEYIVFGLKLFSSLSLLVLLAGLVFKEIYINLL